MTVVETIQKTLPTLSTSERRVAQALFATNLVAGLDTIARLAERAQVSGPTVLRFASKAGYSSYPDFQDALRKDLEERVSSPLQLFESRAPKPARTGLVQSARDTFQQGLDRTFDRVIQSDFEAAVDLLADRSRTVYLAGGRFSHHLAEILWGHLFQLRANAHILRAGVLSPRDQLLDVKKRDVLVAYDLRRYQSDTVELAAIAKRARATIILFTDQWLSPIARQAHYVFSCDVEAPSPYDSLVPCLALTEAVIAGVTERCGDSGRGRVTNLERLRAGSGAHEVSKEVEDDDG
ncbi:MurR/RpiR family transcriptional regulator [Sphingomonas sp. CCH18-H6]|jgi:DNA-binding MurR/RpiR family transcriptional regulator|uniref:MurR/RpiR family transcriptional regulator n=1 Tax=Sphingomonas sp. CCH18-H6 TaxID=1768787 RepID=UPI0008301149|nr:MurR/RpiR family transcriptional regulator [Sphingomonas sp. CCH18-H6]